MQGFQREYAYEGLSTLNFISFLEILFLCKQRINLTLRSVNPTSETVDIDGRQKLSAVKNHTTHKKES